MYHVQQGRFSVHSFVESTILSGLRYLAKKVASLLRNYSTDAVQCGFEPFLRFARRFAVRCSKTILRFVGVNYSVPCSCGSKIMNRAGL